MQSVHSQATYEKEIHTDGHIRSLILLQHECDEESFLGMRPPASITGIMFRVVASNIISSKLSETNHYQFRAWIFRYSPINAYQCLNMPFSICLPLFVTLWRNKYFFLTGLTNIIYYHGRKRIFLCLVHWCWKQQVWPQKASTHARPHAHTDFHFA